MQSLLSQIQSEKVPNHLAIIMDGNGRWAKKRGFLRSIGHKKGVDAVRETLKACNEANVKYLTLYAFSTENWNRPRLEIDTLMSLLVKNLTKETDALNKNQVRLNVIGDYSKLPSKAIKALENTIEETKNNSKAILTIALNYGSKEEILKATKSIAQKVTNGTITIDTIDTTLFEQELYTHNLPPVDLLIRTSGEQRISNFLLWQIAYAELYFTEILWPDITKEDIFKGIINYQNRERRFGKTGEQLK